MNRSKFYLSAMLLIVAALSAFAQKEITVDDLYYYGTFRQNGVYGIESMKDGEHYTNLTIRRNGIEKYSYKTGEKEEALLMVADLKLGDNFDFIYDYVFSPDESKIMFSTKYEPIYRHSFTAEYYIYDLKTKEVTRLSENGKQQLASFSPDGKKVAFVRKNNLYVKDIADKNAKEVQLTTDGEWNKIINGAPDWVYEEEFSYNKAYDWSADGKKIAFQHYMINENPKEDSFPFKRISIRNISDVEEYCITNTSILRQERRIQRFRCISLMSKAER